MEPNIKLGKLFGIEIGVNYSWFIISLLNHLFFLEHTFTASTLTGPPRGRSSQR